VGLCLYNAVRFSSFQDFNRTKRDGINMRVTVVKKQKESDERLIARFNKAVQRSKKIQRIRDTRYNSKKPRKRFVRAAAIKREGYRAAREKQKFY